MGPRMEKVMVIHPHEASFSLDFRMEKVEVHGWGCQHAASPRGAPCLTPSRIGYSEVLFCPRLFIMRQKMQLTLNGLGHWPRLPLSLLPLFPCERIVKKETQNQACRGAKPSRVPILGCLQGRVLGGSQIVLCTTHRE